MWKAKDGLNRCQSIEMWDALNLFKVVRNTWNSDFRLDSPHTGEFCCKQRASHEWTLRRVARHWRSHLSKKRKNRAICRATVVATYGLPSFLPRRDVDFPRRRSPTAPDGLDQSERCARAPLMASIFLRSCDFHRARRRSHFLQSSSRSFRSNKIDTIIISLKKKNKKK